jgi:hypothetical protein
MWTQATDIQPSLTGEEKNWLSLIRGMEAVDWTSESSDEILSAN